MCGIIGFNFEDKILAKKMCDIIFHRGPDDEGYHYDKDITLGQRRLSIIDLYTGKQPIYNEDESIVVIFNGEIYNFRELRENLEQKGHRFYTATDTEVIVHAYEEYGIDFIKKFRGMFAFALYDSEQKKLILARDPIGKKPLYYYSDGNLFIFASEIKAILEADIEKEVDLNGLSAFLVCQYTIGKNTMFKNIKKLLGGEMLIFDIKNKNNEIKRYWDVEEDVLNAGEEYFIKKLRFLLEESAKLRTIADVPVGAFLSGGLDSTSAVGLTKPNIDYDFHTFSMGFGNLFSELNYARIAAEHYDTVHHEIVLEPDEVVKEIDKIAWHYDEPLGDAAIIANYFLSKEARKYVKVVVAGEGGDELFGGYSHYKIGSMIYYYFMLPKIIREVFKHTIPLCTRSHLQYFVQNNFNSAYLYLTGSGITIGELKMNSSVDLDFDSNAIILPKTDIKYPLNRMLAFDCKNLLPEKFLMKADKATMANSIEERLPLLDKKVIEFAFRIPPGLKIKHGDEKYILKQAVRDLIPEEILRRKKTGFNVPYLHWMKYEMKDLVEQKISDGELINTIFKKDMLKKLISDYKKDESFRNTTLLWNLFALELWHENFMVGVKQS